MFGAFKGAQVKKALTGDALQEQTQFKNIREGVVSTCVCTEGNSSSYFSKKICSIKFVYIGGPM